uniref:PHD-type domain-containing protein n=1 Tax=Strigamia maritima TaxID=126957 RepID=T1JA55_STRMM
DNSDASFTDDPEDTDWCSEDDPDRLWCVCKQPHNDRFMILCESCKDWFHGTCVNVTRKLGKEMEKKGQDWFCPKCIKDKSKPKCEGVKEEFSCKDEVKSKIAAEIPAPLKRKPFRPNQLPSVISREKSFSTQLCIVGCGHSARCDSIYCSNECIQKHANESLQFLNKIGKSKPNESKKDDLARVVVWERGTGKILNGPNAPTESNLQSWLNDHPTFEVLRPGSAPSNKKVEKEKFLPEKRETPKKQSKPREPEHSGPEPIRLNVRKTLRDILIARCKDTEDVLISTDEIKKIVLAIEEELFKYFSDIGSKYKAKYRSLMFNIKDPKNHVWFYKGLFRKILKGKISPYKLVRMTPEELASKELAMWRERETKHALEIITREQKDVQMVPIIKKTHKGEIEIQDEPETIDFTEPTVEKPKKVETPVEPLTTMLIDTTERHRSHLFDLNCKICTGKVAPPADEPPPKKVKVATSISVEAKSSSTHKDRKEKGSKEKKDHSHSNKEKERERDRSKSKVKAKKEKSKQMSDSKTEEKVEKTAVKSILKETIDREPSSTVSISSPDSAMPSQSDADALNTRSIPSVWKGFIIMQDVAKLVAGAFRVSGPTDFLTQDVPDTIQICGRINPVIVWDYIGKVRHSGSKEFVVIRFQPANDEEKVAYVSLYHYLSSRKRFGVVGNAAKMVKDFYIIPLASHEPVPTVLKPFEGPGLEDPRPHMLLGVIIRHKGSNRKNKLGSETASDKQ